MTVVSPLLNPLEPNVSYDTINFNDSSLESFLKRNVIPVFISYRILKKDKVEEKRLHLVSRRVLQAVGVVGGFAGRIPFVQMNLDLAGENKMYGVALAAGSSISFGYLISYAFLEIIQTQMGPLAPEERILMESRLSPTLKKTLFSVATVLGLGAQIPFAYIAYQYNPPSPLNPNGILMPAVVFAVDSWISIYSAFMGLKVAKEQKFFTNEEFKLSRIRKKICDLIDRNLHLFVSGGQEIQHAFVTSYRRIQELDGVEEGINACYELFTQEAVLTNNGRAFKCDRYMDFLIKNYGYLCSVCNVGTLGYVAWCGTNALIGNMYANIGFTALSVGTSLYLNATAIPEGAVALFRCFQDLLTCRYQPTLASQLTPKFTFVSNALILIIAALSYGPAIALSKDYYGSKEELESFMEIILSCGTIFLVAMPMLSITNQLLEYKIEKWGSNDEKEIIEIYKKMRHFSGLISASPLIQIARFLEFLPETAIYQLFEETDLTLENLQQYINRHTALTERPPTPLTI